MKQIQSTELARKPSEKLESAMLEPLAITHYRRVKYIILSKAQYNELITKAEKYDSLKK